MDAVTNIDKEFGVWVQLVDGLNSFLSETDILLPLITITVIIPSGPDLHQPKLGHLYLE